MNLNTTLLLWTFSSSTASKQPIGVLSQKNDRKQQGQSRKRAEKTADAPTLPKDAAKTEKKN